jgi:hypothetical protein
MSKLTLRLSSRFNTKDQGLIKQNSVNVAQVRRDGVTPEYQ